MRRILKQLCEVAGVNGSAVVTRDGMLVASHMSGKLVEDVVAAVAALVIRSTRKHMESHALGDFTRFTLVGSQGKLVFTDTGPAFLVVVVDRNAELGPVDLEIESAAMRIRKQGELRI